ncbi:MAG: 50S ribosomal protein L1 [Acidobacteria bacterium]|nr:50S ribosomal protein L1 [Acidobacteriota bacterium]
MSKRSKRYRQVEVNGEETVALEQAVEKIKSFPSAKFRESVELSFKLGVDPRQSDQQVRGTVDLPHGTGKQMRIVVFCQPGPVADAAKEAGAMEVGMDDLVEKVSKGWTDFDVAIATEEAMKKGVGKLGRVLGPRGLQPNKKTGTVTDDVATAVAASQGGRVEYKMDKTANLHVQCGKKDFEQAQLVENVRAVIDAVNKAKPEATKGMFIKNCSISATMSPGVRINLKEA